MQNIKKNIIIWGAGLFFTILAVYTVLAYSGGNISLENSELGIINKNDWSMGNPNAPITLIEYSDFQCPACFIVHKTLIAPLLEKYENEIYYAFRHFPLKGIHPKAVAAGRATEAAGAMGKFWEMGKKLFETQEEWSTLASPEIKFYEYAEKMGLNLTEFKTYYLSSNSLQKVESSYAFAVANGLNYTPSLVLNGELIENPRTLEEFESLIEELLAQSTKP